MTSDSGFNDRPDDVIDYVTDDLPLPYDDINESSAGRDYHNDEMSENMGGQVIGDVQEKVPCPSPLPI